MNRYRYMVVKYPHSVASLIGVANGRFVNHLPIHEMLHEYHWTRLDDDYVLVLGEYPVGHHNKLVEHKDVLMLPSIGSSKMLGQHGKERNKSAHTDALLKRYDLSDLNSMSELLDEVELREGPVFSPIR